MKKLSLIAILAATSIYAAPTAKINLGYTGTTGDTETANTIAKVKVTNTKEVTGKQLHCAAELSAMYSEASNVTTNREYAASINHKLDLTDSVFAYGNADWMRNKYKGLDNKTSLGLGVGYDFYRDSAARVGLSVGAGYMWKDYTNDALENFGTLEQALYANIDMNPNNKGWMKISVKEDMSNIDDNYIMEASVGAEANMIKNVTLSIGEYVTYDNQPAAGADKTNTKTIVSVGYTF